MNYKDKNDEDLVSEAGRSRIIDSAPVEMMRRLKNSIEKLDKNTQKYSKILIFLTIILGILAVIQICLLVKFQTN